MILLLSFVLTCSNAALAQPRMISVSEGIEEAFANNPNFSLLLWERELKELERELERHPMLNVTTTPVEIKEGSLQFPTGVLSVGVPLTEGLKLNGTFSIKVDQEGIEAVPSADLVLNYDFFKKIDSAKEISVHDPILPSENELIMKTVTLLIDLREKRDNLEHKQGWYAYYERALEAAAATPDYDDLALKREIRRMTKELADLTDEVDQLQKELRYLLGHPADTEYLPIVHVQDYVFDPDPAVLTEEALAYSTTLEQARVALEGAQQNLAIEKTSRGWKVTADGKLGWHPDKEENTSWSVGLTASKTLYPRHLTMEKLELQVAQAELHFHEIQRAVVDQAAQGIKGVRAAQERVELYFEQLQEAQEDLDLVERQFAAGFVTELKVMEAELNLQSVELDYSHAQLAYAKSLLQLYGLCGRELKALINELLI